VIASPLDRRIILIIDDDDASRDALAQVLQTAGYQAHQAGNGQEALDWLETTSSPPGLILLDLDMPVIDGRKFLSCMPQRSGATPIVIVITGEDPRFIPGAAAVLRKPIFLSQLLNLMQSLTLLREKFG
jgi:CheY-like chemotaxis protein